MELRDILPQLCQFLATGLYPFKKICPLNFYKRSYKLTDILSIKPAIGNEVLHIPSDIWGGQVNGQTEKHT